MPNGWFRPGDRVPVTGIYTARHEQHRNSHDVVAAEGEKFPRCRTCGESVMFALAQSAGRSDDEAGFGKARKPKAARKKKRKSAGKE